LGEQVEELNQKAEKFVVVTHHAPSQRSIPANYRDDILSAAYASQLDQFVEDSLATVWIHGHIHEQQDYIIGRTRVLCNPRGYPDEPNENFRPDFIIEV
jgi:Icc-related predicted phosphoesterase